MDSRINLFWPGHVAPESDTFVIPYGKQMTLTAIGLQPGDEVKVQMVHVPTLDPDTCACPPGNVTLPSVAAYTYLTCCCEPIKLTADRPVIVLDNPQRMLLRAELTAADTDGIWVWAAETDTRNVTDSMRGCDCGTRIKLGCSDD